MKTRFCPSPTGYIHLGNARTALFSALLAQSQQGQLLFRVEDTDQTRSKPEYVDAVKTDLTWMHCDWQDGPYFQSQRQAVYDEYYEKLIQAKLAYPCFCSEAQLALARKVQRASGKPPRYAGTCCHLSAEDVAAKKAEGLLATLRFHIPENETITFTDFVRGEQRFLTDDIGDFIIRRADGTATFMYCNAIDDALMGVTHVLRGEDHLTNTPRQLLLLKALGLPLPDYGHIALIVGADGSPLSKRHGSQSIQDLRMQGYLSMAIVNYLARLGHTYESNDFLSMSELAKTFVIDRLHKSPARFDEKQLQHWQKQAISALSEQDFWAWLPEVVRQQVPETSKTDFIQAIQTVVLLPDDANAWATAFFAETLSFTEDSQAILDAAHPDFCQTALTALKTAGADHQAVINHLKETLLIKGKAIFQPLRVALTGQLHGPDMASVFALLGPERLEKRLSAILTPS